MCETRSFAKLNFHFVTLTATAITSERRFASDVRREWLIKTSQTAFIASVMDDDDRLNDMPLTVINEHIGIHKVESTQK